MVVFFCEICHYNLSILGKGPIMRNLIAVAFLALLSCGKDNSIKYYKAQPADFQKFINSHNLVTPNLSLDRFVVNNEYPIQIALYQDQKFYYDLPNLGDGEGSWKYQNGYLRLTAKRSLFDMIIDIHHRDQDLKNLAIEFRDRFGLKTLKVENENMD